MTSHKKNTHFKNVLSDRDLKLLQLDEEIKKKKALIFKKNLELERKKELNPYLEKVNDYYKKYYETEVNKKKNELKAMTVLNDYITYLEDANQLIDNQYYLFPLFY